MLFNYTLIITALDYDTGVQSYTLTLQVSDGTLSSSSTIVVNIAASNQATPTFASNPTISKDEDTTVGAVLTTYTAADADASPHNIVKYEILSGNLLPEYLY